MEEYGFMVTLKNFICANIKHFYISKILNDKLNIDKKNIIFKN